MDGFKRDETSGKTDEPPEVLRSPPDVPLYFPAVMEMHHSESRFGHGTGMTCLEYALHF